MVEAAAPIDAAAGPTTGRAQRQAPQLRPHPADDRLHPQLPRPAGAVDPGSSRSRTSCMSAIR
ncbi:MAG: hypothetical protein WDM85_15420 [Caulobacteraceae bacterium]